MPFNYHTIYIYDNTIKYIYRRFKLLYIFLTILYIKKFFFTKFAQQSYVFILQSILFSMCFQLHVFAEDPERRAPLPLASPEDLEEIQNVWVLQADQGVWDPAFPGPPPPPEELLDSDFEDEVAQEEGLDIASGDSVAGSLASLEEFEISQVDWNADALYEQWDQELGPAGQITENLVSLVQVLQPVASIALIQAIEVESAVEQTESFAPLLEFIPYGQTITAHLHLVKASFESILGMGQSAKELLLLRPIVLQNTIQDIEKQVSSQQGLLEGLQGLEVLQPESGLQLLIDQQATVLEKLLLLIKGLKDIQALLEREEGWQPPSKRPPGGSPPPGAAGTTFGLEVSLSSKNSHIGIMSSLQGLHSVFLHSSEYIFDVLKHAVLNTTEQTLYSSLSGQQINKIHKPNKYLDFTKLYSVPLKHTQVFQTTLPSLGTCQVFCSTSNSISNLENKIHSTQTGIIARPLSQMCIGLVYNTINDTAKIYQGFSTATSMGSAKATTKASSLSSVFFWNKNKAGVTGHLAGYCGWGKMGVSLVFPYSGKEVCVKGNPTIGLHGGLIQVGYTFQLMDFLLLTPYLASMFTNMDWSTYEEIGHFHPLKIHGSKERIIERNVGLKCYWKINEHMHLQSWITNVKRKHRSSTLKSNSMTSGSRCQWIIPSSIQKIHQNEIGLSYFWRLSESINIGAKGVIRFGDTDSFNTQYLTTFFQYAY